MNNNGADQTLLFAYNLNRFSHDVAQIRQVVIAVCAESSLSA